jgi:hypothetical protein
MRCLLARAWSLLLAAVIFLVMVVQPVSANIKSETFYYGIEISGTLCGYMEINVSPLETNGREKMLIEQRQFILLSALGMKFDSNVLITYHVDPETNQWSYVEMDVKRGRAGIRATVQVDGDTVRYHSTMVGDKSIPITPDVLMEHPMFSTHLIRDFVEEGKTEAAYWVFDLQSASVQKTICTKVGTERIELAGRKYDALVLDQVYPASGLRIKSWTDTESGLSLKIMPIANRLVYLAKPSVIKKIKTASLDEIILTDAGEKIADVSGLTYLEVKAVIEPVGLVVTPEGLNVRGQTFTGTVEDNLVNGTFEIAHRRYDDSTPPPFPPDYSDDASLREYLAPSDFIESSDPVLVEEARRITAGSENSWTAAVRLSRWVGENIAYAIPGGLSARNTYDLKAGECGAHSLLLAALCRAVGIPARVVWGCMYLPQGGGSFGQHGWNEIYMGEAGWIPVDATAMEFDYVDSGHIRFGVFNGTVISFNPREMRILDYRVGDETGIETAVSLEEKYSDYLGDYEGDTRHKKMEILVKDNSLTLDIKGRIALAFNEPDEQGKWVCKMAPHVYLTFDRDEEGAVNLLKIHEVVTMPKKSDLETSEDGAPAELRPLLGVYHFAALNADFRVEHSSGCLAVYDPLEKHAFKLQAADENGWRRDEYNKNSIYFEKDAVGRVTALKIDSVSLARRK